MKQLGWYSLNSFSKRGTARRLTGLAEGYFWLLDCRQRCDDLLQHRVRHRSRARVDRGDLLADGRGDEADVGLRDLGLRRVLEGLADDLVREQRDRVRRLVRELRVVELLREVTRGAGGRRDGGLRECRGGAGLAEG